MRAHIIEELEAIDRLLDKLGEDIMVDAAASDGASAVEIVEEAIDDIKKKTSRILELVTAD